MMPTRMGDRLERLMLYRESPQLRVIVRMCEPSPRPGNPSDRPGTQYSLEALATLARDVGHNPQPGTRFFVSVGPGAGWCGWSLEPLAASTVDEAMVEAEARMGVSGGRWIR